VLVQRFGILARSSVRSCWYIAPASFACKHSPGQLMRCIALAGISSQSPSSQCLQLSVTQYPSTSAITAVGCKCRCCSGAGRSSLPVPLTNGPAVLLLKLAALLPWCGCGARPLPALGTASHVRQQQVRVACRHGLGQVASEYCKMTAQALQQREASVDRVQWQPHVSVLAQLLAVC
jgi:hypothetical protein